jgi:type II secretory pathway pseudopilin PulG
MARVFVQLPKRVVNRAGKARRGRRASARSSYSFLDRGYTLVEALLLVTILAVTGTSIGEALLSSAQAPYADEQELLIETQLLSEMEALRATWQSLPWGASTTQITIGQQTYTMIVDKEKADPNGGGVQTTFYSLTVQINDRSVVTYVSE